ncbi:Spp1p ASCRUDRAFT_72996 [Ascoidea rubescens DSM 1968]|uniref:Zinc finger PHD-type domain-containing protein n=1 Tax=Ascoidea rubescens DSM 1968 TaxID=1344418 RepID=A0A1D2V8J4_9ASCO|nr:hypothetical protein ASCRUDRAFT_72996 [Ascoidea rubescens DSM 1968]ODV57996.1 hypothetical protein ASCRUDRAFT_72996 [Ascoidea rubescens DSM 1968]
MSMKIVYLTHQLSLSYPKPLHLSNPNQIEDVFCLCSKPDNGDIMISCDSCFAWYHFNCLNIHSNLKSLIFKFNCPYCVLEDALKDPLMFYKKCLLEKCFNPINKNSKFCSLKHGQTYFDILQNIFVSSYQSGYLEDNRFTKYFENLYLTNETPVRIDINSKDIKAIINNNKLLELKLKSLLFSKYNNFSSNSKPCMIEYKFNPDVERNIRFWKNEILLNIQEINFYELKLELYKVLVDIISSKLKSYKICGYNSILSTLTFLEFAKIVVQNKYSLFSNFKDDDIFSASINSASPFFNNICEKEKRKCRKHAFWNRLFREEIETRMDDLIERNSEIKLYVSNCTS